MKQRTWTALVLALAAGVLLCCFQLPMVPQITAICLSCGSVWEILGAYGVKGKLPMGLCMLYAIVLPLLDIGQNQWVVLGMLVLGLAYFTYQMHVIGTPAKGWMPYVDIVFTVGLYRSVAAFGDMPKGAFLLCLTGMICAATDIFAYLIGSRFGRHKLAPKVSPGKSVEGALGGLIVTVLLITLTVTPLVGAPWLVAVYAAVCSLLGQWGDLSLSAVKRIAGVKDFGKIFPGHGGILDRCDSLIYSLSFTWLLYCFLK